MGIGKILQAAIMIRYYEDPSSIPEKGTFRKRTSGSIKPS